MFNYKSYSSICIAYTCVVKCVKLPAETLIEITACFVLVRCYAELQKLLFNLYRQYLCGEMRKISTWNFNQNCCLVCCCNVWCLITKVTLQFVSPVLVWQGVWKFQLKLWSKLLPALYLWYVMLNYKIYYSILIASTYVVRCIKILHETLIKINICFVVVRCDAELQSYFSICIASTYVVRCVKLPTETLIKIAACFDFVRCDV